MGSSQLAITLERFISESWTEDYASALSGDRGQCRSVLLTNYQQSLPILTYINLRKQMYLDIKVLF